MFTSLVCTCAVKEMHWAWSVLHVRRFDMQKVSIGTCTMHIQLRTLWRRLLSFSPSRRTLLLLPENRGRRRIGCARVGGRGNVDLDPGYLRQLRRAFASFPHWALVRRCRPPIQFLIIGRRHLQRPYIALLLFVWWSRRRRQDGRSGIAARAGSRICASRRQRVPPVSIRAHWGSGAQQRALIRVRRTRAYSGAVVPDLAQVRVIDAGYPPLSTTGPVLRKHHGGGEVVVVGAAFLPELFQTKQVAPGAGFLTLPSPRLPLCDFPPPLETDLIQRLHLCFSARLLLFRGLGELDHHVHPSTLPLPGDGLLRGLGLRRVRWQSDDWSNGSLTADVIHSRPRSTPGGAMVCSVLIAIGRRAARDLTVRNPRSPLIPLALQIFARQ